MDCIELGSKVRDKANLGGTVVGMAVSLNGATLLVDWNNGQQCWIKPSFVTTERKLAQEKSQ